MDIKRIQHALAQADLDGWLLADFHGRNDIAVRMLGLDGIVTRRSFFFIPVEGEAIGCVSPIERSKFAAAPGNIETYHGWRDLEQKLEKVLNGRKRIAMEYSPHGRLPYIGLVDAGTVELVKAMGVEVVSSADLVAGFEARLNSVQIESHRRAAANLVNTKDRAHRFIRTSLREGVAITEYDVTEYILQQFNENGMTTKYPPNCSVDAHAGDPHYEPKRGQATTIAKDQLVLIDLWAKLRTSEAVYGDITWMAYTGSAEAIPDRYRDIFAIIAGARDAAVKCLEDSFDKGPVYGADVDDVCRAVIADAGYGEYFTHRTGHSITTSEHGSGPNIDNLETEDRRLLQPGHLFSIEPGIYMEDCGFRTEINVLITDSGPEVTSLPLQEEIVALL